MKVNVNLIVRLAMAALFIATGIGMAIYGYDLYKSMCILALGIIVIPLYFLGGFTSVTAKGIGPCLKKVAHALLYAYTCFLVCEVVVFRDQSFELRRFLLVLAGYTAAGILAGTVAYFAQRAK